MLNMNPMMLRSMIVLISTTGTNTPAASFTCTCNSPFWKGDGETCADVDDCDESVSLRKDCDGANELCSKITVLTVSVLQVTREQQLVMPTLNVCQCSSA